MDINSLFNLAGHRALVTGSSRGIGLIVAEVFGRAGAHVILNGRNSASLVAARDRLGTAGLTVATAAFDVTDPAAVETEVSRIEGEMGGIDILVNNAGIQQRGPAESFPPESFRAVLETNLFSAFYVAQAVARRMIPRGAGSIINVCSVQSELGRPSIVPYTASKGGLKMMTKGMAAEWGPHGIRVNGLGPGYFKTELNDALVADEAFSSWLTRRTPLGRWGDVDELAGAALFLASDASSFVTGHILYVDGGLTSSI